MGSLPAKSKERGRVGSRPALEEPHLGRPHGQAWPGGRWVPTSTGTHQGFRHSQPPWDSSELKGWGRLQHTRSSQRSPGLKT